MSNGKGSARRPGDAKAYAEGWARIFGPKTKCCKPKKVATVCRPGYPAWTCHNCAIDAGGHRHEHHLSTWHAGPCPICGRLSDVTSPRDYGWPDFK